MLSVSGLPARWVLLSQEKFRPKAGPVTARSRDARTSSISVSRAWHDRTQKRVSMGTIRRAKAWPLRICADVGLGMRCVTRRAVRRGIYRQGEGLGRRRHAAHVVCASPVDRLVLLYVLDARVLSQHRVHSSKDTHNQKHRIDDSPVGMKAAEFLRVCLLRFRERRANGEDLRVPIVSGVPKAGSRSVEERFAPVFWALEKLIDVLANSENRGRILNASAFKHLSHDVRRVRKEAQIPDGRWGDPSVGFQMIRDKISELNRPSITDQLQWACDSLDVTWRDLYPASYDSPKPRFIETRNKIFHSNTPIEGGLVFRETCRMSLLFERLILKALGWSDLDSTGSRAARSSIDREL